MNRTKSIFILIVSTQFLVSCCSEKSSENKKATEQHELPPSLQPAKDQAVLIRLS